MKVTLKLWMDGRGYWLVAMNSKEERVWEMCVTSAQYFELQDKGVPFL